MAAGLARASALVVTYLDEPAVFKVLSRTQAHAPQVPVIVRTQDDHNLERLRAAGATEVVPEAIEGSLMLASHALALVGVPMRRVIRIVQDQRDARYNLLRGFFHGADDNSVDELEHERLATLTLPPNARAVGCTLASFALQDVQVRVLSLRRSHGKAAPAAASTLLEEGDTLVLSGKAEALALAEQRLLKGAIALRSQSASSQ
jgi:CPA2 family monovalent cation:H+ antiporter-2